MASRVQAFAECIHINFVILRGHGQFIVVSDRHIETLRVFHQLNDRHHAPISQRQAFDTYGVVGVLLVSVVVVRGDIEVFMIVDHDQFSTWLILSEREREVSLGCVHAAIMDLQCGMRSDR